MHLRIYYWKDGKYCKRKCKHNFDAKENIFSQCIWTKINKKSKEHKNIVVPVQKVTLEKVTYQKVTLSNK